MSKQQGNRICRDVGHDWAKDTVKDYRRCVRENCKTAERLVNGKWIAVNTRQRSHTQPTFTQRSLFAPDDLFPDKAEERRAEQAYYNLLGR